MVCKVPGISTGSWICMWSCWFWSLWCLSTLDTLLLATYACVSIDIYVYWKSLCFFTLRFASLVQRQRLLFACMVWFTFMYFFWKLGDPFPILSPKHGGLWSTLGLSDPPSHFNPLVFFPQASCPLSSSSAVLAWLESLSWRCCRALVLSTAPTHTCLISSGELTSVLALTWPPLVKIVILPLHVSI